MVSDKRKNKGLSPCGKNEHECTNHVCVNITQLCDGKNDCGDFSDETKCCKYCLVITQSIFDTYT